MNIFSAIYAGSCCCYWHSSECRWRRYGRRKKSGRHEPGDSIQTGYADNRSLSARRYARRFSHRLRTQLRRQAAGMGFPDTGRAFRDRVRGRYLPLAARLDEARNSRRDIRPPLLPLENTRLHGHRHTRDRQPQVIPGRITMGCIRPQQ